MHLRIFDVLHVQLLALRQHVCLHVQAAAAGQPEVQFQLEDFASQDTARHDLRCFVGNVEGHPGEAKSRNVSSNPIADPDGIHDNKDAFGKASCEALHVTCHAHCLFLPVKIYHVDLCVTICLVRLCFCWHRSQGEFALQLYKVIRAKFLRARRDAVFLCPFVVRIECCWIAKFDFEWKGDTEIHILRSCQVCPAIPAKAMPPDGVLCKHLDDMLTYFGVSAVVSLTDLLLMAGDPAPTPGFHMPVRYVASLCHLHSVPKVQFQLKLHNEQTLDTSQARVLAHGHKSLVLQLGNEDAVYKVCYSHASICICSQGVHHVFYWTTSWRAIALISQFLPRWCCDLQIAHDELITKELMIHSLVDDSVSFIVKSDREAFGIVEGAGVGWRFLKLQHLGRLPAITPSTLPGFWSNAFQVQ